MGMGWIQVVPTACWPNLRTNPRVPGVRPRMLDLLSMAGKGPKGGRKTRALGSHRPEQRQRQALPREDALAAAATSPPVVTRGDAVASVFPRKSNLGKQQQQEEADLPHVPGISSRPHAPRGIFSCRHPKQEQGTACVLVKGSNRNRWGMGSTACAPRAPPCCHPTPQSAHPGAAGLGAPVQLVPFSKPQQDAVSDAVGSRGMLEAPSQPRQTPKHLPVSREGPSY